MSERPKFDERDAAILAENTETWNTRPGPRVGDFVRMPDGDMRRFTYDWSDGLQTTHPRLQDQSFFFGRGYMSFSGSLDSSIPLERIHETNETKEGRVWFFHHNEAKAHNGVYCSVVCRVFEVRD